jgi:tetratricopeptide (TPR) repeat protein
MKEKYNNPDFYLEKAAIFLADGDFRQALSLMKIARSLSPDNSDITHKMAEVYLDHNCPSQALDEFLLLWNRKKDPELACELAGLYNFFQDSTQARFFYNESLRLNPVSIVALEGLGNLLIQQKDLTEAIKVLERLKQLSPKNTKALLHLANAYLQNSQAEKARENLKIAYRQEPSDSEVRLQLARLYFAEELYMQAIKLLLPLEEGDGVSPEKLSLLIDCHIGLNHYEEAAALLERFETIAPEDLPVIEKQIQLYSRQRDIRQVEFWYNKLLEKYYSSRNVVRYADYLQSQGLYEKQETLLICACERLGDDEEILSRLSSLYRADRPQDALKWLEKLPDVRMTEERILMKAELLVRINQSARAIQWLESKKSHISETNVDDFLEKLLREDRNYKDTVQLLRKARQAQQTGNWKKALVCFVQMLEIVPDNPDWQEQAGNLYAFDINYPQALSCFEKAEFLLPDERKLALREKELYLSWLYNDFEKSLEIIGESIDFSGLDIDSGMLKIKIYRHLLAEKLRPLAFFEELIQTQHERAEQSADPIQWLFGGFLYLLVGSHFLDTELWAERAGNYFQKILQREDFSHFYDRAYEGLYLVELTSFAANDILPMLREWVKCGCSEKVVSIYIDELLRQNQPEEGIEFLHGFLQKFPENPEYRFRFFELRVAAVRRERHKEGTDFFQKDLRRLQTLCADSPQNPLVWLDSAFASLVYTADFPTEKTARRALQMIKKATKLAENRPDFLVQTIKVYDYMSRIDENERKLSYGKKKLFLEKALLENGESALLLRELGELCADSEHDLDLSYRCLMRALTLEPAETDCNPLLGDYFMSSRNFRQACHYYLKAIEEPLFGRKFNEIADKMQRMI